MTRYIFNIASILLFFFLGTQKSSAQKLKFLIPDAAIAQFAGSIGYFSIGAGYEIFKNKRGYLDFNYGYVPASKGGELHAITVKTAYKTFEIELGNWGKLYPFNPGIFLSYTFHEDLSFKFNPSQYPQGYYDWLPALRPHLSISNELEFSMAEIPHNLGIKKVGLYTEFNTNDFYIVNYFQNVSALSLTDIFQLGVGIRLKF